MRALVLATKYFGLGGAEVYTRMFTEAVAAEGARVAVLSLLDGEEGDRPCPGPYLGDQGRRSTRWAHLRFVGAAVRHGGGYDLLICSHVAVAPVGLLLSRLFRVPYIVLGYGIDVWGKIGARRREALQKAARVVALSHFTARMVATVQRVARDRILVIHPAVDPVLLAQALADPDGSRAADAVTLLTVARLSSQERYKGCDVVISALPVVREDAGPVRYTIVGDGDDRPRLETLAQDRGVAAAVTFAGSVPRSDLPAWYRACDIFVMPSVAEQRSDGWTGEGFGIVYIEAAAFGRPVIAGLGGGAPEAVQDGVTGYTVDGRDPAAVAAALIRLARDDAMRGRMGEAGRQWVRQQFSFERFRREAGAVVGAALGTAAR